ncbi:NAD-dependent epimerase/dehydratase family protein [Roseivivax sp. CAU 1761]
MGALSRVAITGAAGYLGRAALAEARRRDVAALPVLRGTGPRTRDGAAGPRPVRHDLATAEAAELAADLDGVTAVIHCAGHLGASPAAHARDTLLATERLLAAMAAARVARLVLVSSLAVYAPPGPGHPPPEIAETSPLAGRDARDPYVAAKLHQEEIARRAAAAAGIGLWILRPGIVWGPGRTWNAHLGPALGPLLLRVGGAGELPLAHVETVARALLDAAARDPRGTRVINVLDEDRPDRARFLAAHRAGGWPRAVLPLPRPLLAAAARGLAPVAAHLPGLLQAPTLARRMAPARYPNAAQKAAFGVHPEPSFEARMAAALGAGAP